MNSWIWIFSVLFLCVILPARQIFRMRISRRKRKGVKQMIPAEMLREFVGKECTISLFNEIGAIQGRLVAMEENWIKVEEKKKIRVINGDMVRDITIAKAK